MLKFSNLTLKVRSAEVSSSFYKKLGFHIVHANDTRAIMALETFEIVLVQQPDPDTEKGRGVSICISIDNADAMYMELIKKGVRAAEPLDSAPGVREFTVVDPDGYSISFIAPNSEWS